MRKFIKFSTFRLWPLKYKFQKILVRKSNFRKFGTEGYRVPASLKIVSTEGHRVPARKKILGTDGYRAEKNFWVLKDKFSIKK